jgi:hypothetical protein
MKLLPHRAFQTLPIRDGNELADATVATTEPESGPEKTLVDGVISY